MDSQETVWARGLQFEFETPVWGAKRSEEWKRSSGIQDKESSNKSYQTALSSIIAYCKLARFIWKTDSFYIIIIVLIIVIINIIIVVDVVNLYIAQMTCGSKSQNHGYNCVTNDLKGN